VISIRSADPVDAPTILALRHAAEDWLASKHIDQWRPREVPLATIDEQVAAGEFYVGVDPDTMDIVAAMRVLWCDPLVWDDDEKACYVHGLVIDRSRAGSALGEAMVDHAAGLARCAGVSRVRLDCAESNPALRSYYRRHGFVEVGRRDFDDGRWFNVVLLEKTLRSTGERP
jgi:ribosomal protein S18 acetylase RimI-like enzyme